MMETPTCMFHSSFNVPRQAKRLHWTCYRYIMQQCALMRRTFSESKRHVTTHIVPCMAMPDRIHVELNQALYENVTMASKGVVARLKVHLPIYRPPTPKTDPATGQTTACPIPSPDPIQARRPSPRWESWAIRDVLCFCLCTPWIWIL